MPDDFAAARPGQLTITRILRRARRRHSRKLAPHPVELAAQGRPGLTQDDVARALGISKRWYRDLELGKPARYSARVLESVRDFLDLDADEWDAVWRLACGRTPAALPQARIRPAPAVERFVEAQEWPALAYDDRWELLAFNSAAGRQLPWVHHESNVLSWVVTAAEARDQLVDWETDWAAPLLSQLQYLAELHADDAGLQALVRSVRADPLVRKLWHFADLPTPAPGSLTSSRMIRATTGETRIQQITVLRMRVYDSPSYWLAVIIPQ